MSTIYTILPSPIKISKIIKEPVRRRHTLTKFLNELTIREILEKGVDEKCLQMVDSVSLVYIHTTDNKYYSPLHPVSDGHWVEQLTPTLCAGYALKKKRYYLGIFPNMGGGLPKSQNFCKFTKYFFVCQIHSEVLKHVLQMGG